MRIPNVFRAVVIVLAAVSSSVGDTVLRGQPVPVDLTRVYEADKDRIRLVSETMDLAAMRDLAAELEIRWAPNTNLHYFQLIGDLCAKLQSRDFGDRAAQYDLIWKEIQILIQREPVTPIDSEVGLLRIVDASTDYSMGLTGDGWAAYRSTNAWITCHVWARLRGLRTPGFDFNQRIVLNPMARFFPDVESRKAAERFAAANSKKLEELHKELNLQRQDEQVSRFAREFLLAAYSRPPFNDGELKQFLDSCVPGEKDQMEFLRELEGRKSATNSSRGQN